MKKFLLILLAGLLMMSTAQAAPKWNELAAQIESTVREAVEIYKTGNGRAAKEKINDAYYGIYEKEGLESTLRVSVSSKSVGLTEYQFYKVKKAMLAGDPLEKVEQEAETLIQMVYENVDAL